MDVAEELQAIRERLERIEETQQKIYKGEEQLDEETRKLLEDEEELKQKLTRMKFSDIIQWKNNIWTECPHKETRNDDIGISYWCRKLDSPCRFEDCPLNQY